MAKIKLRKFDPARYLKSVEDLAAYVDVCFDEAGDDPAFIKVAEILASALPDHGPKQRE